MSGLNEDALLQEFVSESREHLSSIEPDLLILERDEKNTDPEIINRIFRAIHSIKGASGFFGLESLKCLSHSMENTLMLLRDGKLLPSTEVMDPLLIGVDRLRLMLEDVQGSDRVEFRDIVNELEKLTTGKQDNTPMKCESTFITNPEAQTESLGHTFNVNQDSIISATKRGQKIYHLHLNFDTDFYQVGKDPQEFCQLLESTGIILESSFDLQVITGLDNCLESTLPWHLLYASVLEEELIAFTFELNDTQFHELKTSYTSQKTSLPEKALSAEPENTREQIMQTSELNTTATNEKPKSSCKSSSNSQCAESNETIRVKVDLLNKLMDLAGELVLARNQLNRIFESQTDKSNDMNTIIQNVDLVTSDLQEHIMQTRMQTISSVFGKFPRVVRDLSRQLKKEINLEMVGEEVELDKSILESLSDPLTHLIRNCCDHAMELPEVREANGKPRQGTILLKAYQESGHINIAVIDDGAGIDHDRIAKKALESGVVGENALQHMTPQEQVNLIFMPGFSTAEQVTDVSGRGVGMDVVRTNIEQIGGNISIETEKGRGTTILLRLPLTLAIIPSLVVTAARQTFAVPQINLVELVCVNASMIATKIEKVGSAPVLRLRGKLLPLIKLSTVLGLPDEYYDPSVDEMSANKRLNIHDERQGKDEDSVPLERRQSPQSDYNILVLKAGNRQYGLIVDEIRDIEEIVVKPLSSFIKNCKCFSGATIMGDGRVAMILDVAGIINIANLSFSEMSDEEQKRKSGYGKNESKEAEQQSQSVLLFTNASEEIFAFPISSILRLEKIQMSSIETIGRQRFLPYQGKSMSLIFLEEYLPVASLPTEIEDAFLIIPNDTNTNIGIVASSILDAVEVQTCVEPSRIKNPAITGSAVINNHITIFINPEGLINSAGFNTKDKRNSEWQADRLQPSS